MTDDALRELALHYAGRYATSKARLLAYLNRKIRERGWDGERPPDPDQLIERFVNLGYVDDAGYAAIKATAMTGRGLGTRRVSEALRQAGIAEEDRADAEATARGESWAAAERFARRKRIGPFAMQPADRPMREKQVAAFLRAGHGFDIARRWVDAMPGEPPEAED